MAGATDKNGGGFAALPSAAGKTGLPVLDEVRQLGADALGGGLEFPTVRHEDWRFTNLAPVGKTVYELPSKTPEAEKDFSDRLIKGMGAPALVFVNGFYSASLSNPPAGNGGAVVCALSEAARLYPDVVAENLGKLSNCKDEYFTALNTALFADGAFVHIPTGSEIKDPVYIVYMTETGGAPLVTSPRNLIVAGDNCRAKIVEHYISGGDGNCLSNTLTEVSVGAESAVEHYCLEFESGGGVGVSTLNMIQQKDSNTVSHSVLTGGAIVRNNVHPKLAGTGCNSLINGLFMPTGRQHMDNFMKVEHAAPHCDSRQLYNGVLNEKGRGVFHGRIIVHEGAIKTDAKQTNRNLLLSDTAQIDTKPQLEIYNDDVKCTHGATIGQMDEEAVFYLRSRGIPESEARAVILRGFTGESLALMTVEPVRDFLEKVSEQWFTDALDG